MSEPNRAIDPSEGNRDVRSGETALFRAVIVQAINDATGASDGLKAGTKRLVQAQARTWLTKPSRDLAEICALADLEMDQVMRFAKAKLKEADEKPSKPPRPRQRFITFNGRTMNVTQWAKELGLDSSTIHNRISKGWPIERVLSAPALITVNGMAMTLQEWAKHLSVNMIVIRNRLERGLPLEGGGSDQLSPMSPEPAAVSRA